MDQRGFKNPDSPPNAFTLEEWRAMRGRGVDRGDDDGYGEEIGEEVEEGLPLDALCSREGWDWKVRQRGCH